MSLHDLPNSIRLRSASSAEFPEALANLSQGVRESVSEAVRSDSILNDVFISNEDGTFGINRTSAILSGHFEGMPLVPWVVSKRLAWKFLWSNLYGSTLLPKERKVVWKTSFPGAVTMSADNLEFRLEEGSYVLKSGTKPFVSFEFWEHPEAVMPKTNLGATHVKDTLIGNIQSMGPVDSEEWILQSEPFQFATAWSEIHPWEAGRPASLLGGYFNVPADFIFVDEHWSVHSEIVEESVAQIASMAYARSRGLPTVRTGRELNPKAQVLTFKSSIAERERGILVRGDQLCVAIEILAEEWRNVTFAYEAWNLGHMTVMSGIIEGTAIPLKLLKRMVG